MEEETKVTHTTKLHDHHHHRVRPVGGGCVVKLGGIRVLSESEMGYEQTAKEETKKDLLFFPSHI